MRTFVCWNTWSSVDGSPWEGLGDVTLLERMSQGTRFNISEAIPSYHSVPPSLPSTYGPGSKLSVTTLVSFLPTCHAPLRDGHGLQPSDIISSTQCFHY